MAISQELADGIAAGELDIARGRAHTWPEWQDLEADGVLCLGYRNGKAGEHEHWPEVPLAPKGIDLPYSPDAIYGPGPQPMGNTVPHFVPPGHKPRWDFEIRMAADEAKSEAGFPRAEVLWLVKRLERSEYERGQMKAENRRLLRRLRKLRHKRGKR